MVLWSGTLGSNLTVAGAPALYVALRAEKEDRKVSLREFLSWSLVFCLVSAVVCYVLGMLIWVLPYAELEVRTCSRTYSFRPLTALTLAEGRD